MLDSTSVVNLTVVPTSCGLATFAFIVVAGISLESLFSPGNFETINEENQTQVVEIPTEENQEQTE